MAVVTDSTAALPPGAAARWGITVVPLDVVVDGQQHSEGVSLTPSALVDALRRGAKVSTSQPPPEAFARAYAEAAASGAAAVVSVHLSGELSGTVAAAHAAAERAALPVHVVDSRTTAMALGSAALAAAWTAAGVPADERLVGPPDGPAAAAGAQPRGPAEEHAAGTRRVRTSGAGERAGGGTWPRRTSGAVGPAEEHAAGGSWPRRLRELVDLAAARLRPGAPEHAPEATPDEVVAAARSAAGAARIWFLVDSLEHLRRGGRLSAPAAALGTVLGLRPLLTVADGKVVVAEKIRTRRAARARLEAVAVTAAQAHERVRLVVHHLGEPEAAAELGTHLAAQLGPRVREVVVAEAGAVLGAHVGPGLLAVVVTPA